MYCVYLGKAIGTITPPDNSVDSAKIVDGTIVNADVNASAAITTSKLSGAVTSISSHGLGALATLGSVDTGQITANAVGLTQMADLARGKIIVGDASGNPSALTVGSNGQALVSDGTDISWGSAGASSLNGLSDAVVTATSNIGLGTGAVDAITTGDYNVGLGDDALTACTSGFNNVAVWAQAREWWQFLPIIKIIS